MTDKIKGFANFLTDIVHSRKVMWGLARNDLKSKFASSFLGGIWAFIQPFVTLVVFWFVFEIGFKSKPVNNAPFIVWLAPAFLVWNFFVEALVSGTNCLMEYGYLVKKVNFRVSMIPLIKIISSAIIHVAFILIIFLMLFICDVPFSVYNLQVIYYFISTCLLLVGVCWFLSAVAPFVKDVVNIVSVLTQIGFWATPIFWSPETMSPWVQTLLKVNPMFYICQGYRDSFVDHVWFWNRGFEGVVFWLVTAMCFFVGAVVFRKLRPQFADVL